MTALATSTEQSLESHQKEMNDLADTMKTMAEDKLLSFLHQQADPWNQLVDSYKAERSTFHKDIRTQAAHLHNQALNARKTIIAKMQQPRNERNFVDLAWAVDGYRKSVAFMSELLETAPTYQPDEPHHTDDVDVERGEPVADSADRSVDDIHDEPNAAESATPVRKRRSVKEFVIDTATNMSEDEPKALRMLRKRHNSPDRRPKSAHV